MNGRSIGVLVGTWLLFGQIPPASDADASTLQVTGPGEVGYSRAIMVARPRDIRDHNPNADPPLPILDHDGIDDAFIEKGSVMLYWSGSRWLRLAGANVPTLRSTIALQLTSGGLVVGRLRAPSSGKAARS